MPMTQYPHDRFDDVPAYTDRKGAHRAAPPVASGPSGLVGVSVAAALALVVGAFCFLILPSLLPSGATVGSSASASASPETAEPTEPAASEPAPSASETRSPSATPSPSETPSASESDAASESPEPSPSESETAAADTGDASAPVEVYNASSIGGLAGRVSGALSSSGFSVAGTGNWQGFPVQSSAVYYSQNETTAQAVAAELGLPLVQDARIPGIAVVLNADYSG
ncbi:LytR C-terminal domain-containing protein [Citricoccus sp. NPDC055426]|uniref:LytR C-terminal domain-containing protein n=1 Tax=Citricoccus sp. NPDC055426 TaxID=3155536 RepID=UPI0034269E5C